MIEHTWIALPNGWTRSQHDPSFAAATHDLLTAVIGSGPDAFAAGWSRASVEITDIDAGLRFAAQYFACDLGEDELVHAMLFVHQLDGVIDVQGFDEPNFEPAEEHSVRDSCGRSTFRRVGFQAGSALDGSCCVAIAQYFVEFDADTMLCTFATTSLRHWDTLLSQFDSIVAAITFSEGAAVDTST